MVATLAALLALLAGPGGAAPLLDWGQDPMSQVRSEIPSLELGAASASAIDIPAEDVQRIGRLIWLNECGGTVSGLTSWNQGEEFASLGIGHFIWYPAGPHGPFDESFPRLLALLSGSGVPLPSWLSGLSDCPWRDRESFLKDIDSPRMRELRDLLTATVGLQARFAVDRLEAALPRILDTLPVAERGSVTRQFYRVARSSLGAYALVDYVNFKGEGVLASERYAGLGWGLLQVLQGMSGSEPGPAALDEFSLTADRVLTRRVLNSPPERREERWLPAWRSRVRTSREGPLALENR